MSNIGDPRYEAKKELERRMEEIARRGATMTQKDLADMLLQSQKAAQAMAGNLPSGATLSTPSGSPMGSVARGNPRSEPSKRQTKKATLTWNIEEVKAFLIGFLPKSDVVPFLWGPPGIGKSQSVAQVAKALGWKIIDLRLSQLNPVDLRGLPVVDRKKAIAKWLPPEFLPRGRGKGILFLDELNNAPLSVQAAAFELIFDKRLGNYKFPKSWRMVAAGNREGESTTVFRLPAPLANRFIHLEVKADFGIWEKWAKKHKIDKRIIEFLAVRPRFLFRKPKANQKTFPSPRSWAFGSDLVKGITDKTMAEQLLSTAVGPSVAHEFAVVTFNDEIISARAVMREIENGKSFKLPKDASVRATIIEWARKTKLPLVSLERLFEQMGEEEKAATLGAAEEDQSA